MRNALRIGGESFGHAATISASSAQSWAEFCEASGGDGDCSVSQTGLLSAFCAGRSARSDSVMVGWHQRDHAVMRTHARESSPAVRRRPLRLPDVYSVDIAPCGPFPGKSIRSSRGTAKTGASDSLAELGTRRRQPELLCVGRYAVRRCATPADCLVQVGRGEPSQTAARAVRRRSLRAPLNCVAIQPSPDPRRG